MMDTVQLPPEFFEVHERIEIAKQAAEFGIFDFDIVKGTMYCDQNSRKIYGISPDLPVTVETFVATVHPDDRLKCYPYLKEPLDLFRNALYKHEYRIINQTTKETVWLCTKGKVFFENGKPVRLAGIVQDISEYKNVQREMLRRNEELSFAYREMESFSYSVSHDLRSPLNTINCLNEILLEEYSDKLDDEGRDLLNRVKSSVTKMASVIDDTLRLSGITRGTMNRQDVDISSIVRSAFCDLQMSAPERTVKITFPESLPAFADMRLMSIAISNLIDNAWKYSSRNPDAHIEVGRILIDRELIFFVRDNGIGFDMKFASKLFKPFERLHTSGQFPGTGIGLAIVYKIIQRHGGRIWVESEINKGTTFFFTLERSLPSEGTLNRNSSAILIIDDDSNDVFFTKKALRKIEPDCTLEVASDGNQAIKRLSNCNSFQLILLDLKLPGIGGIEILDFIKSREQLKKIPVVIVSSSTMPGDIQNAFNAGAVNYISKSFDFNEFTSSLKDALDTILPARKNIQNMISAI